LFVAKTYVLRFPKKKMVIHIQKCQNCGSTNLKNIILRESGEPDRIYAQCHDCQEFVASYVISPLGYYNNGKGYESFLRGIHRSGEFMSGRNIKKLFLDRRDGEERAFTKVIEELKNKEKKSSKNADNKRD
jgi:hypothetical protein